MIQVTANTEGARRKLEAIRVAMNPVNYDHVIERVAWQTFRNVVTATPKKWFGQVRKAWVVEKPMVGARNVVNRNKVMRFLEFGTRPHGPVTKKWLYIPLTRKAALGWVKGLKFGGFRGYRRDASKKALARAVERQNAGAVQPDYILAKWVRGITPMKIVERQRKETEELLARSMAQYLREMIRRLG